MSVIQLENYEITVIRTKRKTADLKILPDGTLILRAPLSAKDSQLRPILEKRLPWIKAHVQPILDAQKQPYYTTEELQYFTEQAKILLAQRTAYYAEKIGVSYGKITVRCQRTRWGSCSSNGNLSFHCLLADMPIEVLDSVVVHELCHRKEMNHSAAFYAEILRVFPMYPKWNDWLKTYGPAYLYRIPPKK